MNIIINPKRDLFGLFFFANIISIIYLISTGNFLGLDSADYFYFDFEFFIFSVVFLFSYYFILFPLFKFLGRLNFGVPPIFSESSSYKFRKLDFAILILQGAYFSVVLFFDAGKIGVIDAQVPLSWLWAFIQIDYLTTFYLILAPKNRLWKINFLLYAASSAIRGWTGFILILGFIYIIKRDKPFSIGLRGVFLYSMLAIFFLPIVLYGKFLIRTRQIDIDFDSFLSIAFGYESYFDFARYSLEYFANRFQQISITWHVWEASDALSSAYNNGSIAPFWAENLYGYFFYKLMGLNIMPNLGIYSTLYMPYNFEVVLGSFNISPGLIGWIGAAGSSVLGLVFFLAFLAVFGFFAIQLICNRGSPNWIKLSALLWLMWLILLLPGWLNQFVAFLHSSLVFALIAYLCRTKQ